MWYGDKMWMFACQQLSDRGFGLVLLILLGLLSGIEISCCMDPKLVAWSWKDMQGTILHQFKSWSCIWLNHSERSHELLPFGRRPSPGSKKVLCMQKQTGLSWVQLSKSFQERTLKVVFRILHSLECHSWKTFWVGLKLKIPQNIYELILWQVYLYHDQMPQRVNSWQWKKITTEQVPFSCYKQCWDDIWFRPSCCSFDQIAKSFGISRPKFERDAKYMTI